MRKKETEEWKGRREKGGGREREEGAWRGVGEGERRRGPKALPCRGRACNAVQMWGGSQRKSCLTAEWKRRWLPPSEENATVFREERKVEHIQRHQVFLCFQENRTGLVTLGECRHVSQNTKSVSRSKWDAVQHWKKCPLFLVSQLICWRQGVWRPTIPLSGTLGSCLLLHHTLFIIYTISVLPIRSHFKFQKH